MHLDELDVLPEHGCRGVGSALLRAVENWARNSDNTEITLTTFRDVPWNAPFYSRIVVKNARHKVVKRLSLGVQATNMSLSHRWRVRLAKGKYTWAVHATDAAGNTQSKMVSGKLVIR